MASSVALQQTTAGSGWVHSPPSHPEHPGVPTGAISPLLSQYTTGRGDPALPILSTSTWLSTLLGARSVCPMLTATAPGTLAQPGCIITEVTAQLPGQQLLLQQPTYKREPSVASCMQRLSKRTSLGKGRFCAAYYPEREAAGICAWRKWVTWGHT